MWKQNNQAITSERNWTRLRRGATVGLNFPTITIAAIGHGIGVDAKDQGAKDLSRIQLIFLTKILENQDSMNEDMLLGLNF